MAGLNLKMGRPGWLATMNHLTFLRTFLPVDLKNTGRDSLLAWISFLPLVMALAMRWAVPALSHFLSQRLAFDLQPYYPLILSGYLGQAATLVGMVVGMLLLDERDEQLNLALLVTPLPPQRYLAYRIVLPIVPAGILSFLGYLIIGLGNVPAGRVLVALTLSLFNAPLLAFFLVAFAENKVVGLALMKMASGVMLLPVAAYFIPEPWQWAAGLIPTYWGHKLFWLAAGQENLWPYFLIGLIINLLALVSLLRLTLNHSN